MRHFGEGAPGRSLLGSHVDRPWVLAPVNQSGQPGQASQTPPDRLNRRRVAHSRTAKYERMIPKEARKEQVSERLELSARSCTNGNPPTLCFLKQSCPTRCPEPSVCGVLFQSMCSGNFSRQDGTPMPNLSHCLRCQFSSRRGTGGRQVSF